MIKSMTGFGRAILENDKLKVEVEIKSLNSKIFDLKIKFAEMTAFQEMEIRNILSKKLVRGKVDCNIKLDLKTNVGSFSINDNVFDKYYKEFSKLNKKYGTFVEEVNFYQILMNLPEVVENKEPETEEFWDSIKNTIEKAADKLDEFRHQEGKATKEHFKSCLNNIDENLKKVLEFEQERVENMRKKLKIALEENKLNVNSDRFESELIYYIEKFDINEEKIRLANHLKYFQETMQEANSGKKLNFITQEIGREINTMGSKANHFQIQRLVVSMKDELEKIKEQVLNVI